MHLFENFNVSYPQIFLYFCTCSNSLNLCISWNVEKNLWIIYISSNTLNIRLHPYVIDIMLKLLLSPRGKVSVDLAATLCKYWTQLQNTTNMCFANIDCLSFFCLQIWCTTNRPTMVSKKKKVSLLAFMMVGSPIPINNFAGDKISWASLVWKQTQEENKKDIYIK